MQDNQLHENGTITYWSVYRQQWVENAVFVPDDELAAMNEDERQAAVDHLALDSSD